MRVYATLESLRMRIAARLGFGGSAQATNVIAPILNGFIEDAQTQLFQEIAWNHLVKVAEKTVGFDQNEVEYPEDCDPARVLEVSVYDGGAWCPLAVGIETEQWTYMDSHGVPVRWEPFAVMQLYPKADTEYRLRIRYVARPPDLVNDKDRVVIDDQLVFLLALANAKYHYRQPDAQSIAQQYQRQLWQIKGRSRGKTIHRRRGSACNDLDAFYSRPVRQ